MGVLGYLRYVLGLVLVLTLVVVLVGQLTGQPLLLAYVETGSMSPTLEAGDGFVAIPPMLAGDIEPGHIVVYDAQEVGGGGLTTHRVVGETQQGYVTKGDANPFPDQDGSEPPVPRGRIKAVALQANGEAVVVPGLGSGLSTVGNTVGSVVAGVAGTVGLELDEDGNGVGVVAVGFGLLLLAVNLLLGTQRTRTRSRRRGSFVLRGEVLAVLFVLVVLVPANASMALPAGISEFSVLSSSSSNALNAIDAGGDLGVNYTVQNSGLVPLLTVLEPASPGVTIRDRELRVRSQSVAQTRVTLYAPDEPGVYPRLVHEHRYIAVLPRDWLLALHRIHPLVAVGTINLLLGSVVGLGTLKILGRGRVRLRSRPNKRSLGQRLRNRF